MAINTTTTAKTQTTVITCPVCGGLECLCRPRFFAGQLLTEDDLNRLDRYIVAKHRLHNRYLHGWGVACGLEVLCHPCAGQVTIKAGYALSPCGDDIVVCRDTVLDVCELINRCRERSTLSDCEPPRQAGQDNCTAAEEKWVLAVRYTETASRGTPALHASASTKSCGCGGAASGGGCGWQHGPVQPDEWLCCADGFDHGEAQPDAHGTAAMRADTDLRRLYLRGLQTAAAQSGKS
ncbi:MAG: hypothetical protein U0Y68_25700 [Blastocatellia bacterium]